MEQAELLKLADELEGHAQKAREPLVGERSGTVYEKPGGRIEELSLAVDKIAAALRVMAKAK